MPFHKARIWAKPVEFQSVEVLADKLTQYTWCCCNGFSFRGYLFLNDSTSANGAQEYAVIKRLSDGMLVQVESITFGWCNKERALEYIERVLPW